MTVLTVYVYNTCMRRKLTLTIDEAVYEGLHRRIGARSGQRGRVADHDRLGGLGHPAHGEARLLFPALTLRVTW